MKSSYEKVKAAMVADDRKKLLHALDDLKGSHAVVYVLVALLTKDNTHTLTSLRRLIGIPDEETTEQEQDRGLAHLGVQVTYDGEKS